MFNTHQGLVQVLGTFSYLKFKVSVLLPFDAVLLSNVSSPVQTPQRSILSFSHCHVRYLHQLQFVLHPFFSLAYFDYRSNSKQLAFIFACLKLCNVDYLTKHKTSRLTISQRAAVLRF